MDTFENVCDIVSSRFELNEIKLEHETSWEEIGADSIDLVDLVTEIEDEFEISIPDEEFENLKTIGDLAELVDQLMI
ncbi:MAG: acyl carrier protein [Faecalibacterium sp.]|nr:acyl carrier protein [Ruminococcus sp.]MCM1391963.1 acyl carrier protein [Ruminococcus sp.]MCM1485078.1 acyl carrier protein [Faecalibacterium sp.]